MPTFPLILRSTPAPARKAAAWFIPGPRAETWLAEMAGWGIPLDQVRLCVLPRSPGDPAPEGVLAILPSGSPDPRVSPLARPYAAVAGKLFLPLEARLAPDAADAELAPRLNQDLLVFHPGAGLAGFGPGDAIAVCDLLERPREREAAWDRADPGIPGRPRLVSVAGESPLTVEDILGEGRDDIGLKPSTELPPSPGEPKRNPLRILGRKAGIAALKAGVGAAGALGAAMAGLAGLAAAAGRMLSPPGAGRAAGTPDAGRGKGAGPGPKSPGWLDRFRSWASGRMESLHAGLESFRRREIERLFRLMEANPDEGLKYALPISGSGHRGIAPPGVRLGERIPDFSLTRLRGGGPADPWDLSWQDHQRLVALYREAANRDLRLGRFRRAAYIFAELLGDFSSAASSLAQGKHFREAAVLYRDRLNLPIEAARCLESGGLFDEAAAIYEAQGDFEAAGDLFTKVDRSEEADRAYRRASEKRRTAGDIVGAAGLLEKKVRAPDEALALLAAGWPRHEQAGRCLRSRFDLLGRLGRHEEAANLVSRLLRDAVPPGRAAALAGALAEASSSYPDAALRRRAADAARVTAGRRLPLSGLDETDELLRALYRAAPQDRLLLRDGNRFRARKAEGLAASLTTALSRAAPAGAKSRAPILVKYFWLPRDVEWKAAAAAGDLFYAAGFRGDLPVALRGRFDGNFQSISWPDRGTQGRRILIAAPPRPSLPLLLVLESGPRLARMEFPASDVFSEAGSAGAGPPAGTQALAYADHGMVWAVIRKPEGEAVLASLWSNGDLGSTVPFPLNVMAVDKETSDEKIQIGLQRSRIFIAASSSVAKAEKGKVDLLELPSPAGQLAIFGGDGPTRVAVTFDHGALVAWAGGTWGFTQHVAAELESPIPCFLRTGHLVLVSPTEVRIFDTREEKLLERHAFPLPRGRGFEAGAPAPLSPAPAPRLPIAVLPAAANEFAIVTSGGEVLLYKME